MGRWGRRLVIAVFLVAASGLGTRAWAQRGIESETFRPTIDGNGIFSAERAETGRRWDIGFRIFSDYAHRPLRLAIKTSPTDTARERDIINYQVVTHLGAHLSVTDWLELAIVAPLSAQSYSAAYGSNRPPLAGGAPGQVDVLNPTGFYAAEPRTNVPPPNAAPLDTRVALKLHAPPLGPVHLGLLLSGTIPFGDETAFLGDRGFTFRPVGILDFTLGRGVTLVVNAGYVLRRNTIVLDPYDRISSCSNVPPSTPRTCPATLIELDDEFTWAAALAYRVHKYVGLAAEVYGLVPVERIANPPDRAPGRRDVVLDVLGGLQFHPVPALQITVGAGGGVLDSARRDAFRVFAGLSWLLTSAGRSSNGGDADRDGIPDTLDKCPTKAEDKDGFQDNDGCPDLDNDGDRIPDSLDNCPNDAEDKDNFQDNDGCPDPDNDIDGVPDTLDKCPSEPEDKDGFQDNDGCPDPDNDGDGIPDMVDKCPSDPENYNGIEDEDGCPERSRPPGKPRGDATPHSPAPLPGRGVYPTEVRS